MYAVARSFLSASVTLITALFLSTPVAADFIATADAALPQWTTKATYQPKPAIPAPTANPAHEVAAASSDLTLGATPDEGDVAGAGELAAYLSRALGRRVVYAPTNNWLTYSKDMTQGRYDLVLDSAHLTAWRTERLQHAPLVKSADSSAFVLVAHANDTVTRDLAALRGRAICAPPAPNLGALAIMAQFPNPARQPHIVPVADWDAAHQGLVTGKCTAAILPARTVQSYRDVGAVLYRTRNFPGVALSAGPRVNGVLQAKIVAALTSDEGAQATKRVREFIGASAWMPTHNEDYVGLSAMLKDSLYYR